MASAGPSKTKSKSKSTKVPEVAPAPLASKLSNDTIESEDESEDESSSSEEEPDSDADLENVVPKQRTMQANGKSKQSGSAWPKYQPPNGMAPVNVDTRYTDSPFEWDSIASKPNVELWAIRVPADLKMKYISSLKLSRSTKSATTLGSLQTRSQSYNLVTAGQTHKIRRAVTSEGRDPTSGPSAADVMRMDVDKLDQDDLRREGGEEMEGMTLMLPRFSKKGKLFAAPKPISRHLILEPDQSVTAEPSPNAQSTNPSFLSTGRKPAALPPTPPKRVQPTHLLKFRNKTVGYNTPGPGGVAPVEETNGVGEADIVVGTPVEKKKRRKSEKEGGSPKKKKTKV